mmetsp:Transcript_60324/g.82754  ORF Transcript_60324/g.82754 Transcript_60324/m.82754 type:complete len:288 (-) Transcript_60324:386-1249(-)
MAAGLRPRVSGYNVHENYVVDTRDNEDHTFNGIMFSVLCKSKMPVEFIEINSISIRGALGPLTVWYKVGSLTRNENPRNWTKVYHATHDSSFRKLVPLRLMESVRVLPNQMVSLYAHSAKQNDLGIVYDDLRNLSSGKSQDEFIEVLPGRAHLCSEPFANDHPWGSWRRHRVFVGRIAYGARYLLWNPSVNQQFPPNFKDLAVMLLLVKPQDACPLSWLSNDCIFYILNMMHPNWGLIAAPGGFYSLNGPRRYDLYLIRRFFAFLKVLGNWSRYCRAGCNMLNQSSD